jgi:hypothetical protein
MKTVTVNTPLFTHPIPKDLSVAATMTSNDRIGEADIASVDESEQILRALFEPAVLGITGAVIISRLRGRPMGLLLHINKCT